MRHLILLLANLLLAHPNSARAVNVPAPLSPEILATLSPEAQLGAQIFFDSELSAPSGQSCASCHDPKTAYTDPGLNSPVSPGVIAGRSGTRNTPSVLYAKFSPSLYFDTQDNTFVGGQFLDGRARDLVEQAKGPFLNPDEMHNASVDSVIEKLRNRPYAAQFKQVFGMHALDNSEQAFQLTAQALAQFEQSAIFSPFSSKYDAYLAGQAQLTDQEKWGLVLFNDEKKGNCAACHPSTSEDATPPLFTDFTYDNIGLPPNPNLLANKGSDFSDLGLGQSTRLAAQDGKFKVPSLRNVAKTAPYTHNGGFQSLREVIEFYSSRDQDPKWAPAEIERNKNTEELGKLNLSAAEIDALLAFLETLTDGYTPEQATPHLNNSGVLTLPKVRIQLKDKPSWIAKAILKQDTHFTQPTYQVRFVEALNSAGDLSNPLLPSFSESSAILDIPRIRVDAASEAILQLQRVNPQGNDYLFEVIYQKALQ